MSKQEYNGSELVVQALKELKVKYIFGYPGGSVLDLYDALFQQEDIEHILVRHEQAATHMADGYARATGEVGVVLATSGPGATVLYLLPQALAQLTVLQVLPPLIWTQFRWWYYRGKYLLA